MTSQQPQGQPTAHARSEAPVVELAGVSHAFGGNEALFNLDFRVPAGHITVVLGPNGAGKTTAVRAVTGALKPDRGLVRTFGLDPDADGHLVRPRCGVVSAKPALYDRLSGRDNLDYAAELYGVRSSKSARLEAAAERFGITGALDDLVGGYSTGMKTRLALARSVLHDPELLLFDEPTSGLDPESSTAVLELIREMTGEGRTVVMCTHLLVEAEGLADHIVIMEGGTALIAGSPAELTSRFWPHPAVAIGAEDPRLLERMRSWPGVLGLRLDNTGARVEIDDLARIPDLVASLAADGVRIGRVEPFSPSLEDLYFLIRRQLSGEARAAGREVKGALDPVATGTLAPSAGMGPRSTTADRMPTMTVPDSLGTDQDVASTEQRGSGS
jgi:ABC-2 type transport system ATP-binding protein